MNTTIITDKFISNGPMGLHSVEGDIIIEKVGGQEIGEKEDYIIGNPKSHKEYLDKKDKEKSNKEKEDKSQSEKHQSEYISNLKKEYEVLSKTMSDEVILIIAPKFASILSNTENAKGNNGKKKTT